MTALAPAERLGGLLTSPAESLVTEMSQAVVVVRAVVGAVFALAGVRAIVRFAATVHEFATWQIPDPQVWAPAIAAAAIVCGVLLAIGALTRPVALLLATIAIGVVLTAGRFAGGPYLYAPPLLFTACVVFAWRSGRISSEAPPRPPGVQ